MSTGNPDTIIIGAGIIGASIAWRLAQSGRRVTLVDAGTMGGEASWAGAGMLAPGGEVEKRDVWTDLALESMRLYPGYVAELESATGIAIDFRRSGAFELAFDDAEWKTLGRRAETQRGMGILSQSMTASGVRSRVPSLEKEIAGALFYPDDAMVDPRDVMRALRAACRSLGVEIVEGWRANAIHATGDAVEVVGANQTLRAATGVLAAGAWTSEVAVSGIEAVPIPAAYPIRGHLLGYQLAPGSLDPILRHGHTYLLQRSSGFTVAGTSSERVGFDRVIDPATVEDIIARTSELMPALRRLKPVASWIGFRPASDSTGPEIRRVPGSNLWLAYGHYRNGILLAPLTAKLISGQILASSESRAANP
jgi:glycine oxidase